MMVGDESVRRSAVDGRSRMSLVGQAPPCRKPDRRDQARFEALNRAGSGWEIVRETLKRPWSTGSDSLSRSRPTSPSWSATRSATCGRHSTRLPISWPCALWSAHRGCRANDSSPTIMPGSTPQDLMPSKGPVSRPPAVHRGVRERKDQRSGLLVPVLEVWVPR